MPPRAARRGIGMNKDIVCGVAALALAIGYYFLADAIPRSLLSDEIGADGLPKSYAMFLAALSVLLIARALLAGRRTALSSPRLGDGERAAKHAAVWRAAGMIAIGIAYVVAVPYLGYFLSIAILIVATTYYQGGRLTRKTGAVAVGGAAFLWVLFVWLLRIPQPSGIWPDLF